MAQPDELLALKAEFGLSTNDIARIAGVNPANARRWCKRPGPGYIPIPDDAWAKLLQAVGRQEQ